MSRTAVLDAVKKGEEIVSKALPIYGGVKCAEVVLSTHEKNVFLDACVCPCFNTTAPTSSTNLHTLKVTPLKVTSQERDPEEHGTQQQKEVISKPATCVADKAGNSTYNFILHIINKPKVSQQK